MLKVVNGKIVFVKSPLAPGASVGSLCEVANQDPIPVCKTIRLTVPVYVTLEEEVPLVQGDDPEDPDYWENLAAAIEQAIDTITVTGNAVVDFDAKRYEPEDVSDIEIVGD